MAYTPTPDERNSIVIYKTFPYRGGTKRYGNRYHFEGDLPADNDAWTLLANAIVAEEKKIFDAEQIIVEAVGNDCGSATTKNLHGDSVFVKSYATPGEYVPSAGATIAPGDAAAVIRYSTVGRSVRNHPVYLFNYYHRVFNTEPAPDTVAAELQVLLNAYADAWVLGFSDGTGRRERCGPHGNVAIDGGCDGVVRHRDFPS